MKYRIYKSSTEYNVSNVIDIDVADDFFSKLKGLMFKDVVDRPLMFSKCKQVHTFFMKIPIDVYYFDKDMLIIKIEENLKPNKIGKYISNAYGVIETKSNSKLFEIADRITEV